MSNNLSDVYERLESGIRALEGFNDLLVESSSVNKTGMSQVDPEGLAFLVDLIIADLRGGLREMEINLYPASKGGLKGVSIREESTDGLRQPSETIAAWRPESRPSCAPGDDARY